MVIFLIVKGDNWYSVRELEEIRICCVVYQYHITHISISQHPQIFDIDSFICLPAVLSEQSLADHFVFRVKVIENHIGIAFMTGSKDHNFGHRREFLQKLSGEGSDVQSSIYFFPCWKFNVKFDIIGGI